MIERLLAIAVLSASLGLGSSLAAEEEADAADTHEDLVVFSKERVSPEPMDGKALVVVVRPAKMGYAVKSFFLMDDAPLGINKGSSYFFTHVDPGAHVFWSKSENVDALELAVEAGKTYYIQQKVQIGGLKARTKLEVLTEEQGRAALEKCSRHATMTERGRQRATEIAAEYRDKTREDLERRARKAEAS